MDDLIRHEQQINHQLARYGVKFGIYKNGTFHERLFPFDTIPRIITAQEWEQLEKGLAQRVNALNLFLEDIYGKKHILADGIVPEDFVYRSPGYLPQCEGITPPAVSTAIFPASTWSGQGRRVVYPGGQFANSFRRLLSPDCTGTVPPVQPGYLPAQTTSWTTAIMGSCSAAPWTVSAPEASTWYSRRDVQRGVF